MLAWASMAHILEILLLLIKVTPKTQLVTKQCTIARFLRNNCQNGKQFETKPHRSKSDVIFTKFEYGTVFTHKIKQ